MNRLSDEEAAKQESINQLAERLYWEFDAKLANGDKSTRDCFKRTIIPHLTEARKGMWTDDDMRECRNAFANVVGTNMADFEEWLSAYRKERER